MRVIWWKHPASLRPASICILLDGLTQACHFGRPQYALCWRHTRTTSWLDSGLTAGSKPRPQAPGPEQLWKYCKRCNSWKERPGDFSKNHRTPDGLQFYCRYCHNRMTKFNQQRRLEDRHIAEKHHVVKSPRKGPPAKITLARASHASSTSHSPSSHSRGSPAFDVISSKIPRQQRTHAIYRRDSDPTSSAGPSPHRQPPLKSPSPNRDSTAGQQAKAQRSLGSDNGICNQGSLDSAKQQVQQLFKPKPRRSPSAHSQARASAELMLQANAVLQELDHSLLQAAEAASAEVAAAAARSASQHDSTAVPRRPVSPSPQANSPPSPLVPRVASSASPRVHVQSQQQKSGRLELGSGFPPGPSPQPLQHRSFSMPAQQVTHPPSSIHTLSHSLAQLRQACVVDRDDTDNNRDKQEQQQQPEQLAQRLTTQSPPLLTKAEPPAAQPGLAAEHAMPDAASEPVSDAHEPASDAHEPVNDAREPVSDAHEPGQRRCHADRSKGLASPERSGSGISPMLQGRSVQGPCGNQSCLPDLAMASLEEPGLKAPMAQADTDSMDIDHRSGSLSKDSLQGVALLSVLHPSHQNAKAEHASKALQPAVSETAALAKALSEASGRSSARAASSPPGALPPQCPALPCPVSPCPGLPWLAGLALHTKCPACTCLMHSSINSKHVSCRALCSRASSDTLLPFVLCPLLCQVDTAAICVQLPCKGPPQMCCQPPLQPPPRLSWTPHQALSRRNPA